MIGVLTQGLCFRGNFHVRTHLGKGGLGSDNATHDKVAESRGDISSGLDTAISDVVVGSKT